MSASLVGSEMCIRDSSATGALVLEALAEAPPAGADARGCSLRTRRGRSRTNERERAPRR
eukprot:15457983-Alexandrium_andersonii.AAC.2